MSVLGKVITGVVLAPIAIVVVGIGGCEARKAYYDWQVRKMCEKDGGVTVIEHVTISQEEYRRLGGAMGAIPIHDRSSAKTDEPYFTETKTNYLKASNPEIRREEVVFIRRADEKVLGRFVYYARVGGDFPSWAHPSSKGCIPPEAGVPKQVFQVEGATK